MQLRNLFEHVGGGQYNTFNQITPHPAILYNHMLGQIQPQLSGGLQPHLGGLNLPLDMSQMHNQQVTVLNLFNTLLQANLMQANVINQFVASGHMPNIGAPNAANLAGNRPHKLSHAYTRTFDSASP